MKNRNKPINATCRRFGHFARTTACALLFASTLVCAPAANIVWVGDYNDLAGSANDTFSAFTPPGDNRITDYGFIRLLQNAGHNVIRYNSPGAAASLMSQADLNALNTNDLVVLGRAGNSPAFQSPKGLQWNTNIVKPLICMSPYFVRPDGGRLGWFTAGNLPDTSPKPGAPTILITGDPTAAATDFLFSGVFMSGSRTAGGFDEMLDRNTSLISDAPAAGGIVYATANFLAEGNAADTTAYVIVGFPAGTVVAAGRDVLAGYRMWFGGGSREGGSGFPTTVNGSAGRENLTADGENIFLHAIELALNNGVAPATDPLAPLTFTLQPTDVTVTEGTTATFRAAVAGPGPRTLQWQRGDGVTFDDIPESTTFMKTVLNLPATSSDNGAVFRVMATGPNGTVVSDAVTLTVIPDTEAPVVVGASSVDGMTITVRFNEVIDPVAAEFPFSYAVQSDSASEVATATLRADGKTVDLTLSNPLSPSFSLTITEISDPLGNTVAAEGVTVAGSNFGLTGAIIGALNGDGGESGIDANSFEVTGGGLDFQAATEQMRLAYKSVSGDFDARIRVLSLIGTNRLESVAKAILNVRASTDGGDLSVSAFVTPPAPGENSFGSVARGAFGGPTLSNIVTTPFVLNSVPASIPNAWLRVLRVGDTFTTYGSTDGSAWTQLATVDVAMTDPVLVGAGVNSHRNGQVVTATFSDFQVLSAVAAPTLANLSYAAGTFTGSFQTQNGIAYRIQYKDDLNAADWADLNTVNGDGSVKSFSNAAAANRFYRVITP